MKYIYTIASVIFLVLISCDHEKSSDQIPVNKLQHTLNRNPVEILVLELTNFQKELISNGKLKALQKSTLKFNTSEELAELYVRNGDKINKGQVIARLNQDKSKQELKQAELQLDKAELELMDILIGQGFQLEDSVNIPTNVFKIAKLRSGFTSAINNLMSAQMDIKNSVLYAPFSGVLANIEHTIYEQVSASDEFCILIDNSAYEVEFSVLETEIEDVKLNKSVRITSFINEDIIYNGLISEINPVVDENGLISVKALVRNTNGLMEGMNVKVNIFTSIPKQLVVPKSAVLLRQNQEVLFKYSEGIAMWTYIKSEFENSTSYTVESHPDKGGKLEAGDTIIISGNLNLAHESKVVIE